MKLTPGAPAIIDNQTDAALDRLIGGLRDRLQAAGNPLKGVAVIALTGRDVEVSFQGCDCFHCLGRMVAALSDTLGRDDDPSDDDPVEDAATPGGARAH